MRENGSATTEGSSGGRQPLWPRSVSVDVGAAQQLEISCLPMVSVGCFGAEADPYVFGMTRSTVLSLEPSRVHISWAGERQTRSTAHAGVAFTADRRPHSS